MNQTMKTWITLLLVVAMVLALSGCALTDGDATNTAAPQQTDAAGADAPDYSEDERAQVAVQVGEYAITKGEIIDEYNAIVSSYISYGMPAPTAEADVETMQNNALEGLVAEKVMRVHAEQMGVLPLDAESAALVQQEFDEMLQQLLDAYKGYATEEGYADADVGAVELINQALDENGWNMDFEEFKRWNFDQMELNKAIELLEAKVTESVVPSEADVQAYYDELVAAQTERYAESPLAYLTAAETYEMDGGDPVLVVPEGYLRVKVIGMQPETEIDAAYDEKMDRLEALEVEYGKLALTDAEKNAARLNEIKAEYATLSAEADTLYDAHTMAVRAKAQEAYAKLEGGAAFHDVLVEYGDDEAYTLYETIAEKGQLMLPGDEDGWDTELHGVARTLADGAYSEVIEVDGVFYILQRVGVEQPGTRSLDEVRDTLAPLAGESAKNEAWAATQDAWMADTSIITYFEEVYRDIGKSAS